MSLLVACFVALTGCGTTPEAGAEQHRMQPAVDALTAALDELLATGETAAFATAIVTTDTVLFREGFGWANVAERKPYTANTVQNIASISKTVIGLALLKAQEQGKLSLDDPIGRYLDFTVAHPDYPTDSITLRQLATHTASIKDGDLYDNKSYVFEDLLSSLDTAGMEIPLEFRSPKAKTDLQSFLRDFLDPQGDWYSPDNFISFRPGERFEYSNVGATLAAHVLEAATGQSYADYTTEHILTPLGMTSSGWSYAQIDPEAHSIMYADTVRPFPRYSLITYPDGGLRTSIADFSLYLQELMRGYMGEGTLLSKASYAEYFRSQLADHHFEERDAEDPYDDEYDFGIFIGKSALDYIGHSGGDPGVSSYMFFNTQTGIGRMMMINTDILSQKGVDQFYTIWNTLEAHQGQLDSLYRS